MRKSTCKSGLMGWQDTVRRTYSSLDELKAYSEMYGISERLGYDSVEELWDDNPTIRGSVDPSDLEVVK